MQQQVSGLGIEALGGQPVGVRQQGAGLGGLGPPLGPGGRRLGALAAPRPADAGHLAADEHDDGQDHQGQPAPEHPLHERRDGVDQLPDQLHPGGRRLGRLGGKEGELQGAVGQHVRVGARQRIAARACPRNTGR